MGVIFTFSHQNSTVSSNASNHVLESVASVLNPWKSHDSSGEMAKQIGFYIRKIAHFGEYFMLGLLFCLALNNSGTIKKKKLFFVSIVICSLYAITDEFHQYFIDGRVASIMDVTIDVSGVIMGATLYLIFKKYKKDRGVYNEKNN